jgi:cyclophilin family peptidyl-prolyl cis-trans isomerase
MTRPTRPSLLTRCASAALLLTLLGGPAGAQERSVAGPALVQVRFTTSAGAFTVEVDGECAPLTVANFTQYVRDGHYAGTLFHRVVGNFVVQGGGHVLDGSEKPTRAPVVNESGNGLSNRRGTIAMARLGDPHSATSQFYVNLVDNLALDPGPQRWGYAVFGRVVEGMDVIDRIASVPTGPNAPFADEAPLEPIVIVSADIVGTPAPPAK